MVEIIKEKNINNLILNINIKKILIKYYIINKNIN